MQLHSFQFIAACASQQVTREDEAMVFHIQVHSTRGLQDKHTLHFSLIGEEKKLHFNHPQFRQGRIFLIFRLFSNFTVDIYFS